MRAWTGFWVFLLISFGLFFGFCLVSFNRMMANAPDYGKRPPEQAFNTLLGYPPPPGITKLRAEGKLAPIIGVGTVWMTFDYTDAALGEMLKYDPGKPATGDEAKGNIRRISRPSSQKSVERMRQVGWDEAVQILKPEVYMLPTTRSYWTSWAGWLVLDRKKRRAYISADN
jgi:hypothetical protein